MTLMCFACASDENTTVNGSKIKFFEFPSDERLQKHWESICTIFPVQEEQIPRYLCELHFDQSSFSFSSDKEIKSDIIPKNNQTNKLVIGSAEPNLNLPNEMLTELNVHSESDNNSSCNSLKQQNAKPYRLTIQIDKVYLRPGPKSKKINYIKTSFNSQNSENETNLTNNQSLERTKVNTKGRPNCHQCSICYKSFTMVTKLYEHVKKHLICDICNTECMSRQMHETHYKLHKSKIKKFPYKCHICQILFASKDAIKKHNHITLNNMDDKEAKSVNYCKTCNMTFRNDLTYRKHLNSHMQKMSLLSYKEPAETSSLVSPIGHLRPVLFTCRVCSEDFTSIADIDKHTKIHMDELKFPSSK